MNIPENNVSGGRHTPLAGHDFQYSYDILKNAKIAAFLR